YGHYLTALKNYYRLLSDGEFTWTPRVEAVNILGQPVTVDYQDERRLASAAVALGRSASRIVDLERRKLTNDPSAGWSELRDSEENWGTEDWATRSAQGNYLHWVMVNALLPEEDAINEGLQKIDRQSVPELTELTTLGAEIQGHMDAANRRTNALGLAENSLMFDLSPAELEEGSSHFDQILDRAKAALKNASEAHERTIATNNLLRSIENQADDYSFTVAQEEIALENRLLDIYGQPYAGDIGPGRTYPQAYAGPDFFRFMYITRPYVYDREVVFGAGVESTRTFELPVRQDFYTQAIVGFDASTGQAEDLADGCIASPTMSYDLNLNDGPYQIADDSLGRRNSTGEVQRALAEILTAKENLYLKLRSLQSARASFEREIIRFREDVRGINLSTRLEATFATTKLTIEKVLGGIDLANEVLNNTEKTSDEILSSVIAAMPDVSGFSNDLTSVAAGSLIASKTAANTTLSSFEIANKTTQYFTSLGLDIAELAKDEGIKALSRASSTRTAIEALRSSYLGVFSSVRDTDLARIEFQRALESYYSVIFDGDTVQAERETFRKRAAAVIQGARVRDVAFRAFRTESLEQYKILFDQAARYAYLAAKAYDYETGLLDTPDGRGFLAKIAETRALGLVSAEGEPLFAGSGEGDPGLSSLLAQMEADWDVLKGRLGINNPDQYGTLFSLRRELFQLPYLEDGSEESHTAWQDALRATLVADLRGDAAIAAHALPADNPDDLPLPGFVIPFRTLIESGKNFFGNELVAGDSAFSSSSFATKIQSVGIAFDGYKGIDPCVVCNFGTPEPPNHNHPDALSATPYVYILPAGVESMRTPPLNGTESVVRSWQVHDHAMPLPFDIGGDGFDQSASLTSSSSLTETFFTPRKHQAFRAFDETELFSQPLADEFTNERLIGRSVWNSEWKLVIPAQVLLADPEEGIERFIRSVRDIKLFIRSYSYSGN
ncbi:MAG: hypothetical protein AAGJ79_12120, partial [Verrucomicrobiota bacterium]